MMAAATAAEAVDAEVAEAENGRVRQLPALSRGGGGGKGRWACNGKERPRTRHTVTGRE